MTGGCGNGGDNNAGVIYNQNLMDNNHNSSSDDGKFGKKLNFIRNSILI